MKMTRRKRKGILGATTTSGIVGIQVHPTHKNRDVTSNASFWHTTPDAFRRCGLKAYVEGELL